MACDNVFDAFAIATESLGDEIYRNASYDSVWLKAIQRGQFPLGIGTDQTTFTIENSEPIDDTEGWVQIKRDLGGDPGLSPTGGTHSGSTCATTFHDVEVGYSTQTYNVEAMGLKGPTICRDDMLFDHNVEQFLRAYIQEMTKRAKRTWEKRYEELYMQFSSKLSVGNGNSLIDFSGASSSFVDDVDFGPGGGAATSTLTQQVLDTMAVELIDRGATNPDSNGFINFGEDGPVFPLLIGLEASQQIAMNNSELRQDFRNADSGAGDGAELLSRIGASRVIRNFRHVPNLRPPRYTYAEVGNKYTRVPTYEMVSAAGGKKAQITSAYKNAPYEAAIVLNPAVFTSEIVPPMNSVAGVNWNPTNYMGEWQWVTGGEKITASAADCADPLSKLGAHYCEFKHAPRPEFPKYGLTMIFKRACNVGTSITMTDVETCSS
jgi:hypothetical protein